MILNILIIVLKNKNIITILMNLIIIFAQRVIIVQIIIIDSSLKKINVLINVKMMILINMNIIIFVMKNAQKKQLIVLKKLIFV